MSGRIKSEKFSDFDYLKLYKESDKKGLPITRFFENKDIAVICSIEENYVFVALKDVGVKIESPEKLTYDQFVLLNCITKSIYYEKITNFNDFYNYMRSARCARNRVRDKILEVARVIRKALDNEVETIEIKENGDIFAGQESESEGE